MVSSVYPAVTYAGLAGHVSHVHAIDQQRIENRINGSIRSIYHLERLDS